MSEPLVLTVEEAATLLRVSRRFWPKVDRRGPDECWPWLASRHPKGYGHFQYASRESRPAHRVAYELTIGPIPDGLLVCHRCDNPPCCNPAHLWLGTAFDNNRDRVTKGRSVKKATHCKKGHPFDYITTAGWHLCRICRLERQRRYIRPSRRGYIRPSRRKAQ